MEVCTVGAQSARWRCTDGDVRGLAISTDYEDLMWTLTKIGIQGGETGDKKRQDVVYFKKQIWAVKTGQSERRNQQGGQTGGYWNNQEKKWDCVRPSQWAAIVKKGSGLAGIWKTEPVQLASILHYHLFKGWYFFLQLDHKFLRGNDSMSFLRSTQILGIFVKQQCRHPTSLSSLNSV